MRNITDVVRQFKQNWTEELCPDAITQACRDAGMKWYESALNPVVTIQIFFVQILHGNTAMEHLTHLTSKSFTAAAYCQARMRLPLEVLQLLLARCAGRLQQETFEAARWLGHRVFHVGYAPIAVALWSIEQTETGLWISHCALVGDDTRCHRHDCEDVGWTPENP